jgi:hypothetical protein
MAGHGCGLLCSTSADHRTASGLRGEPGRGDGGLPPRLGPEDGDVTDGTENYQVWKAGVTTELQRLRVHPFEHDFPNPGGDRKHAAT